VWGAGGAKTVVRRESKKRGGKRETAITYLGMFEKNWGGGRGGRKREEGRGKEKNPESPASKQEESKKSD